MDLDNKLFFAFKEPSNQVTKNLKLLREGEKKKQTLFGMCWAMESFLME
jgi:hypothetical protein